MATSRGHSDLYKGRQRPTVMVKAKQYSLDVQKANRSALLASRRVVFFGEVENDATSLPPEQQLQISQLCKDLSKSLTRESALRTLMVHLSQSDNFVEEFVKLGTTLHQLVGILTGHAPLHQVLVAQCITNIAASTCAERLLTPVGPYLVDYLSSPYTVLKDYSAWAVGNMAGHSVKCRKVLVSQGALPPLCRVVNSDDRGAVHSALFALRNFTYHQEDFVLSPLVSCGLIDVLRRAMTDLSKSSKVDVLIEGLWVLFHLVTCKEIVLMLSRSGVLAVVCDLLCTRDLKDEGDVAIVTACVRILGNSVGHLPELVTTLEGDGRVEGMLGIHADQNRVEHLRKESTWALSNIRCAKDMVSKTPQCTSAQ